MSTDTTVTAAGVTILISRSHAGTTARIIVSLPLSAESAQSLPKDLELSYGRGLNPICHVVDSEDLALPAFGPLRI